LVTLAGRLAKKDLRVGDENATFPIPDWLGPQHLPWGSESHIWVNEDNTDCQGSISAAAQTRRAKQLSLHDP
jgi:hypothetical protein